MGNIIKNRKIFSSNGGASGSSVVIGPTSSTDGAVALFDGTTGKLLKDSIFIPPTSNGALNTVLTSNGSGGLSWAGFTGLPVGGSNGNVQFNNAGVFDGTNQFNWDGLALTIGSSTDGTIFKVTRTDNPYTYFDFRVDGSSQGSFHLAAGGGGDAVVFDPYNFSFIKNFSSSPVLKLWSASGGSGLQILDSVGSSTVFEVAADGNISALRGLNYSFPSSRSGSGYFYDDGSGNISLQNPSSGGYPTIYNNGSSYGTPTGINFTGNCTVNYSGYGVDIQINGGTSGFTGNGSYTYFEISNGLITYAA